MSVSTAVNLPSQPVGGVKISVATKLYPVLDEAEDTDLVVVDNVRLVVDVDEADVELDVVGGF